MKRGIFVFCYPQFVDGSSIRFSDVCYQQNIESCRSLLDDIIVVTRLRQMKKDSECHWKRLEEVGAYLGLELPDYGIGGRDGLRNLSRLFLSVEYRVALRRLFRTADFIYVEGPAYESFLAAWIARNTRHPIMLEMRGEVSLNHSYMSQRFGLGGHGLVLINRILFALTRRQAQFGLYVNRSMIERYPISGTYQQAISSVRLPDEVYGHIRHYSRPLQHFLFVGYLERVKRIDIIIKALYQAQSNIQSDWSFDVVGDGPDMNNLRQLTERLGLINHVSFHGRIAWGEELFKFYQRADVLLMASTSEGTSRTMLEAMASGLPVISTNVGAANELLSPQALVPVGNLEAYKDKLSAIVSNLALAEHFSQHNFEVAQDFHLSTMITKRTQFYKRAIEEQSELHQLR